MNKFLQVLLAGATVICLGSTAVAAQDNQQASPQPHSGHMAASEHQHRHDPVKFREHVAKRQAALHEKLKLTASQEAAWKTYAAAATPDIRMRPDRAAWAALTAPERMEKMLAKMQEREAHMTRHLAAMKTFYAVLSPEQQKVFNDNVGAGRGHHRHGAGKS